MAGRFVVPDSRLKKLKFSVICISNADFKTASGISTASNFAQIKRAFPALKLAATYTNPSLGTVGVYDSIAKGIAFEMLLDKKTRKPGRCLVVSVHYPKRSIFSALKLYPSFGRRCEPRNNAIMYSPVDFNQSIAHRAEYVEERLKNGAPVIGISYDAGVLLHR